jgi:hypothetical protein
VQVPTKYGWVFVNPYMSLVAAYERAIQARGRELLSDGMPIVAGATVPGSTLPGSSLPAATGSALSASAMPGTGLAGTALPGPGLSGAALSGAALSGTALAAPGAAFNVIPAIPAPAANPIEIEIDLGSLNRFTSDTAGYARRRPEDW